MEEENCNINPTGTMKGGIMIAGTCQGPKDIPDTVAQASAVAARVLRSIVSGAVEDGLATLTLADIEQKVKSLTQPGA